MPLTRSAVLEKLLCAFARYYDISREDVTPPFAAEASFHSNNEQYFLVKRAKLADAESHEYLFIASEQEVDAQTLRKLDEIAWNTGLSRVQPHSGHRNTDITLIVLANHITADAMASVKKTRRYKSYRHTLHGWSNYRLVALELSEQKLACNRQGQSLTKLFRNILTSIKE